MQLLLLLSPSFLLGEEFVSRLLLFVLDVLLGVFTVDLEILELLLLEGLLDLVGFDVA